ncbi:MAG: subclass B1 metallo-beta-lactamase [Phaeodactylibacter sp.]|nr:subclass B1 metallo-beta-lactamase [Phaeodactylibacter sp.]
MSANSFCWIGLSLLLLGCGPYKDLPELYQSEHLRIEQLSEHVFVHVSYLETQTFGKVGCNGMIYLVDGEAMVFDTPVDDEASIELLDWLEQDRQATVKGVIVHHFHVDCLGGLTPFHERGIPSHAFQLTHDLADATGVQPLPQQVQGETASFELGGLPVECRFFGEGHTRDNIVSYLPEEKVLFGGCLIKSLGAGPGNLSDANVNAWSATVQQIKNTYPQVYGVVPGHGQAGGRRLLDYTIKLFAAGGS